MLEPNYYYYRKNTSVYYFIIVICWPKNRQKQNTDIEQLMKFNLFIRVIVHRPQQQQPKSKRFALTKRAEPGVGGKKRIFYKQIVERCSLHTRKKKWPILCHISVLFVLAEAAVAARTAIIAGDERK